MANIHDSDRGMTVTLREPRRALAPNFPGWEHYTQDDFVDHEPGITGVIVSVESHGSNPWTRYSVRWEDGSRSSGVTPKQIGL
jgi:hypothetical protein